MVSELFDEGEWMPAPGADGFTDITSHVSKDGRIARIAFDRPEVRNAFRPHTVDELYQALDAARQNPRIGVILLTGNGPSPKDGGWAFCSGGDQRIRGRDGYKYSETDTVTDPARAGRLHILEVQRLIRFMPKVAVAVIPGWAAGGGSSTRPTTGPSVSLSSTRPATPPTDGSSPSYSSKASTRGRAPPTSTSWAPRTRLTAWTSPTASRWGSPHCAPTGPTSTASAATSTPRRSYRA